MLETGFGIQDFTPEDPSDGAFRVYDPISFRALILRKGDTNVTFLAGDCFSIEEDLMARVRVRLEDIDWLNPNHILPCASHVGTTPILFQSYVSIPCETLKYYGREDFFADNMLRPSVKRPTRWNPPGWEQAPVPLPNILYNRRSYDQDGNLVMSNFKFPYPRPELTYADVDDNVYVLRIDDTEGNPTHCAIVFGCHALCTPTNTGIFPLTIPASPATWSRQRGSMRCFFPEVSETWYPSAGPGERTGVWATASEGRHSTHWNRYVCTVPENSTSLRRPFRCPHFRTRIPMSSRPN